MDLSQKNNRQSGAVSLFVVIFTALLMTIVTVGFIQLMLKDQQQATTSDLSQSAYDSALAGVEDAKRLLLLDQSCRNGTAASTVNCTAVTSALTPAPGQNETNCDTLSAAGVVGETDNETVIQQSTGDGSLDQAYTCVKIGMNTDDYKGDLAVNESAVVPLQGVSEFDTIVLSWFNKDDIAANSDALDIDFPSTGPDVSLPPVGDEWQFNYPSLLRTQFIQTGGSFSLGDFDNGQAGGRSNTNTLFMYPSETGLATMDFATDARRNPDNAPQLARCQDSLVASEYACSIEIKLPNPIDNNTANRNAFLHLNALYNSAHYKIELRRGATPVQFNRVQPIVDSTGRANDAFRRVQARVELKSDFAYPDAAIDIEGDLCKNFTITDTDSGYTGSTTCTP